MSDAQPESLLKSPIRIGHIVGFHGLQGDVKVKTVSENPDWLHSISRVTFVSDHTTRHLTVTQARLKTPRQVVMRFKEFTSRTAVEQALGFGQLYVEQALLPPPDEKSGEYWVSDLIGLSVMDLENNKPIGVIQDTLMSGGSDFLEIRLNNSPQTVIVPFNHHFFPDVCPKEGYVGLAKLASFLQETEPPSSKESSVE